MQLPLTPHFRILQRLTRSLRHSIVGIILTVSYAAILCQELPSPSSSSSAAPARDAAAVATITASLNAMGGNSGWSALHAATTTGTSVRNGETSNTSFTWSDDWSGEARMRRDNGSSNGGPHNLYTQDAPSQTSSASTSSASTSATTPRRPRFDNVPALVIHLPGAALFLALQNPAYAITAAAPSRSTPPNTSCVRVRRTPTNSALRVDDITMCFSAATSLPVSAYVSLPDLFHSNHQHIESIQYEKFQPVGAVLVPQQVSVTTPGKQINTIIITSASWNPAFSNSTFSGVSQ